MAVVMANLKGTKKKPSKILTFAEAVNSLIHHKRWGLKEMSRYFGASQYMLRQIGRIDDLEEPLKKIIKKYNFGIETAYHLWRIQESKKRGLNDAIKVSEIFRTMTSEEIRTFMHFLRKDHNLSLEQCKELADKVHPETIRILAIPLSEEIFNKINELAKEEKLKIHDYVLQKILKVSKNGKKI